MGGSDALSHEADAVSSCSSQRFCRARRSREQRQASAHAVGGTNVERPEAARTARPQCLIQPPVTVILAVVQVFHSLHLQPGMDH